MTDPRIDKLAQVLIDYSLSIKPGDTLLITSPANAAPLVHAAHRAALRAGALVNHRINLTGSREILLRHGSDEQIQFVSPREQLEYNNYDAFLFIIADENTRELTTIDPMRQNLYRTSRRELNQEFDQRTAEGKSRWCLTLFPTQAYAQDAGMSLEEYENFVFKAGLIDQPDPVEAWRAVGREQQRFADYLNKHDLIHVTAPGTDITYRVGGRKWINADGRVNFPDGEVFSAPIEDSVNGVVTFSYPAIYLGNLVENVRLVFKDGEVTEATASSGEDFLRTMIAMDEGSKRLGEVAFGTNYGIQHFTKAMLFDEKIGGTMHMALGAAYAEAGGKNNSGLHWDMLCDLHKATVTADGEVFYQNGRFTI
jgi:aminopeptidase